MEVIMKKALIIVFIMCLLGLIFLSGSIGIFYEPIDVSLSVVAAVILIMLIIIYLKHKKGK